MIRPGARALVATAFAVLLAACGGSPYPDTDTSARGDGWTQLSVGGTVRALAELYPTGVLVAGVRDGGGSLLSFVDAGSDWVDAGLPETPERFDDGGLTRVSLDGESITGVGAQDPLAGTPADYWAADLFAGGQEFVVGAPRTRTGAHPVWLVPLQDGEGDIRAMGLTRAGDRWRVHAWELFEEWTQLQDSSPQLYLDAVPGNRTFLVGNTEAGVVVAGPLAVGAGKKPVVSAWTAGDGTDPSPWVRLRTSSQPDRITDVADWDVGLWIAGARQGRPVVYEFGIDAVAPELAAPPAELDPEEPTVLIARQPIGEDPLIVAVQSAAGPALWVPDGPGWREFPAPAGELQGAQVVGRTAYLVIDGHLWRRELPADLVPANE